MRSNAYESEVISEVVAKLLVVRKLRYDLVTFEEKSRERTNGENQELLYLLGKTGSLGVLEPESY